MSVARSTSTATGPGTVVAGPSDDDPAGTSVLPADPAADPRPADAPDDIIDDLEFLLDADPAACAERATELGEAARSAGDPDAEMRLAYYAGYAHHLLGDDTEALAHARRAEALATERGDLVWRSRALACRGLAHHSLGDVEDAVDLLRRAVEVRREAQDEAGTAEILNSLGTVYTGIVQFAPEAARVLTDARRLWQHAGDSDRAAIALTNLATTYVTTSTRIAATNRRGAMAAARYALQTAQKAVDESDAAGLTRTAVEARLAVVGAHLILGDLAAADGVLQATERMLERFPAARQELALARARAEWLLLSRRYAEAIRTAEGALAQCQTRPAERLQLLRVIVEAYEGAGDAVSALRRLHELHDLSVEQSEALAERRAVLLGSRLEVERAERAAEAERRRAAQLEARNTLLAHEAMHDALTGLPNRRALDARLTEWTLEAPRPFSVALVDIDHFKVVNDTWSHQVGDHVLNRLGAALRETLRDADLPARYGGEEFALLLGGADGPTALRIAERVRAATAALTWDDVMPGHRITVSIGLATCHGPEDVATLLGVADAALYRAKAEGRNRVCLSAAGAHATTGHTPEPAEPADPADPSADTEDAPASSPATEEAAG